jgi:hypothetical protein
METEIRDRQLDILLARVLVFIGRGLVQPEHGGLGLIKAEEKSITCSDPNYVEEASENKLAIR